MKRISTDYFLRTFIKKKSKTSKIRMLISGLLLILLRILSMYVPGIKEINSGLSGLIINGILITMFVFG